jgi:hypothetical protein
MTRVVVPTGAILPVVPPGVEVDPLSTNRNTRYRFDLLDDTGRKFGELDGVSSGTVEWNANSQVKGGGKIVVSKANDVHDREIRVSKNHPVAAEQDFETEVGIAGNAEFSSNMTGPKSCTQDTTVFYEGGASCNIEYAVQDPAKPYQNAVDRMLPTFPGQKYTIVARVLNPDCPNVYLKASFIGEGPPIAQSNDWQTVYYTFTAYSSDVYVGFNNKAPVDGTHLWVDNMVLYEGEATGYNGESYGYAPFSWMHARVRPVLEIEGLPEEPLGVFLPAAPVEQWDESGGRQNIELLDRTSIISQDYVPTTYTVKANANVISEVRKLIASTGERVGSLTKSDETTTADMMWGAGTNKLTIINELLDSAGYFGLWADGHGQFRVEKYRSPKDRPVVYQMLDNKDSIYIPTLSIDRDIYSIPNRVIMTAQGSGESEGWTAVATNENEASPFSYQRRGRWVTDVQLGIEATSLENLQSKAERRLSQLSATQATFEVQHAPVPGLKVNDVIRFRRNPADVDTLATVTKTSANFDPMSLAKTTLTEVVDL